MLPAKEQVGPLDGESVVTGERRDEGLRHFGSEPSGGQVRRRGRKQSEAADPRDRRGDPLPGLISHLIQLDSPKRDADLFERTPVDLSTGCE